MSRLKKLLGVIGLVLVFFLGGFAFADGSIRTFEGHKKAVNSFAFSSEGTMIASGGGRDGTIELWDAQSGKLINTLKGHTESVMSVAFSPDGTTIASGSRDKTVKLWDLQSGRLLNTIKSKRRISGNVAFSPDGTIIAFSDYQIIKLWDIQNNKFLRSVNGVGGMFEDLSSIAFSPDGTKIVSAGSRSSIRLWNTHSFKLLKTIRRNTLDSSQEDVGSIAFSPDGTKIASAGYKTIKLWDALSVRLLNTLEGHKYRIYSVAFSPDGSMLASGGEDKTVRIWDMHSGRLINTLKGHTESVMSVAFSPDGTTIVSGSSNNTIKLWDISPFSELLAKKVYKSIDKSDYILLYAFIKKFYNHINIVQQAYRDMHKELIKIHQMAFDKAKEIDTVSVYNTFIFAYPYASQVKEANKRAYELEKEHYADSSMLGFLGKDKKMNKQARSLLIEAQSILDIALDKDKNASIIDTGYYIVVNRMYRLAKNEFANTDRVLTLKESPELKRFDKIFQKKLQERKESIKKIESGQIGDVIEMRVDSTKAVMSHAGSDSKMKEFYLEQTQKSNNFESLYQKSVREYKSKVKSELKKAHSFQNTSVDTHRAKKNGSLIMNNQKITQNSLELAKLGSKYLFQKNYIKAESYLEKACTGGNMPSCHNLANLY